MILLHIINYLYLEYINLKTTKINENKQKNEKTCKFDINNSKKAVKNKKKAMPKTIDIPQY